jgi:hypothetical protein
MCIRPEGAALILLEQRVMQEAEDGLEEKADEDDNADDGVVAVELGSISKRLRRAEMALTKSMPLAMYTPKPKAAM